MIYVQCTGAEVSVFQTNDVCVIEKSELDFILDKCFVFLLCGWLSGCFVFVEKLEKEKSVS